MSTEGPLVNNGEHLYYKNIAHNVLRQSKIEETKKNQEDNFTMEFNFQPQFLKTENDNYSKVKSKIYQESIPISKYVDENATFQPNKNIRAVEIKGKEEINKMSNRLYTEQKKFKEKKEILSKNQIKEQCPFMPKINVPGKADPKYFMMRLQKWSKKIDEKNKENIDKKNNLGELENGKSKSFQPVVKDPIAKKMKRENEVHIDLYNKGLEHINYRKSIMTTDTREDLVKIDNEKKERIKNLKEERERYKKEKQEKMEKEINERTLKAKIEKENLDKIIRERTDEIMNLKENKNYYKIQSKKITKGKNAKSSDKENKKNLKDKKNKTIINEKEKVKEEKNILKENPKKVSKSIPKKSTKENEIINKKKPISSKERVNTEVNKSTNNKKAKITKESKSTKNNNNEKITQNKIEKKERNKSQPQKNKKKEEIVKKEKKTNTIAVNKEKNENKSKGKKAENKNEISYANKLKNAKININNLIRNKNEIIGELEFNNMKNNKKQTTNYNNTNEYNVVSVGSKTGKIKNEKKAKK